MRQTTGAPSRSSVCTAGSTRRTEMKLRSMTAMSMASGNISGVRARAFVRSMTTTRLSLLRLQASWP